jgi:hypothetical protein
MLDPISLGLTGISLFQKSVEMLKSGIDTANDIRDIAGAIDGMFEGEKQINQQRFGNKSILGQTKDAASSVIDAKLAREAMDEMHTLVDNRFGFGTWAEIIAERNKRIQEEKEAMQRAKAEKLKKRKKMVHNAQIIGVSAGSFLLIIAIVAVFALAYANASSLVVIASTM